MCPFAVRSGWDLIEIHGPYVILMKHSLVLKDSCIAYIKLRLIYRRSNESLCLFTLR